MGCSLLEKAPRGMGEGRRKVKRGTVADVAARAMSSTMTDDSRLTLFAYWRTSATYRVRVALALKRLKAEEKIVDIDAGEHRSPEFLKINPLGAIPALIDGEGDPLTQSLLPEFAEADPYRQVGAPAR